MAWLPNRDDAQTSNPQLLTISPLSDSSLNRKKGITGKLTLELVRLYEQTKRVINLHYLNDLSKATWTVFGSTGNNKALMFKCKASNIELNAVIMPLEVQAA